MMQLDILTNLVTGISKAINAIATCDKLPQKAVVYDNCVKGKMSTKVGIKVVNKEVVV